MSLRGRPGSSQGLNDPQRMPFEAAEALLWGKKTHDEHKFLFPRMRTLEKHHEAYDHRIQATEAVAEAAQAATARIVRVEQKVDAIEADEQDRPFDKWVEGEISGFKSFIEKNKSVRQKQVELETKVYGLEDVVDRNRDAHRDVQILLERIARLENERINDSKKIDRLETEVEGLARDLQERVTEHNLVTNPPVTSTTSTDQAPLQAFNRAFEAMDAAEETEDEDMLPHYPFEQSLQQAVAPRPRESRSPTVALPTSPQKGREHLSARLRMMQRNSIYEPKQSRNGGPLHMDDSVPPTQIVDRRGAGGGGHVEEVAVKPSRPSPRKSLVVRLKTQRANTQDVKIEEDVPIPRVTRSQARRIHAAEQSERKHDIASLEIQAAEEPVAKRRKLKDTRASAQTLPRAVQPEKKAANPTSRVTNLVQSPRKSILQTEYEQSSSRAVKSPSKKPARTAKEVSSPQKNATQPSTGAKPSKAAKPAQTGDGTSMSSRTLGAASSPRKKNAVQAKATSKTFRAKEPIQPDLPASTSSRTLQATSSPRKKNPVSAKSASRASRAIDPVPSDFSIPSSPRLVSPKKTYSKSKSKREVLPEVRHDTYDFIDEDEW